MTMFFVLATTAFCRIATPTTIEYAPDLLWPSWNTPTAEQYVTRGWLYNRVSPAEQREGMVARLERYEARDGGVYAVYAYSPMPTPIKTYSVARLIYWLNERELYARAKEVLGESLLMQAVALGDFSSDNEDFVALLPSLYEAFGREIVDAALEYASGVDAETRL